MTVFSILPRTARAVSLALCLALAPAAGAGPLEISGLTDEQRQNVEAYLELATAGCDTDPAHLKRLLARVDKQIAQALRALGYYSPRVTGKELLPADKCWRARISVEPGEAVRVDRLSVSVNGEAEQDATFQAVLNNPPLRNGDILHHGRYEDTKRALLALASQRGYFDGRFTRSQMLVDPKARRAEVHLAFDSGTRYRVGEIRIAEQAIDENLVRRYIGKVSGKPYDGSIVLQVDRNLRDSGYFSSVEVLPLVEAAAEGQVPLEVRLQARPRHAWRFGAGYASDKGPRATVGYENRRLSRRGHSGDIELRVSPVETRLGGAYRIPGQEPQRTSYALTAVLRHETNNDIISDSLNLGVRYKRIGTYWTREQFLELLFETSEVGTDNTTAYLLMPGVVFSRTFADDLLRTSKGYRVRVETRGSLEGLGSTATFAQVRASLKGIHRFGGAGRITARADLGTTLADSFFDLPASLRFFAGGDNSVRGYGYQRLGPLDSNGDPEGGRHLLTGSLEYEHPLVGDDYWGAVFIDGGDAFAAEEPHIRYGYGLGGRWYSPVGRVRVDLAFPTDTTEDDWRLHFSLGVDL